MIGLYVPLSVQTACFLQAAVLGAGLALLYEVLAAVRICMRAGTVLTALCDILFWLAALAGYFVFTVSWVGGQVRGFLLLGCVLGGLAFRLTLGAAVRALLTAALRLASRIVRALIHPVLRAFRWGNEKFLKKIQKKTSIP